MADMVSGGATSAGVENAVAHPAAIMLTVSIPTPTIVAQTRWRPVDLTFEAEYGLGWQPDRFPW